MKIRVPPLFGKCIFRAVTIRIIITVIIIKVRKDKNQLNLVFHYSDYQFVKPLGSRDSIAQGHLMKS